MERIRLKVDEANKKDVGRQIARIPNEIANQLNLKSGDPIEIKGVRSTYAKVWRTSSTLIKSDSIQIESNLRINAGVNLDDFVEVSSCDVKLADNVTLQPLNDITILKNFHSYLSKVLQDRILAAGDILNIKTGFGGDINLRVIGTQNDGPVIFSTKSKLVLEEGETSPDNPSAVQVSIRVSYEDIGGIGHTIKKIREMIELPLRFPQIFERLGIQPPKGVLLFGPPGTGKTLLAKAVAGETSSFFVDIRGPEIVSKYYGESENKLREIFEEAKKKAPSIIFIDEIDSITPSRDSSGEAERRIVAQLLTLMDGIEDRGQIVIIGATNRPDSIDPALRRGGRFDREIEIGIPDLDARLEILNIQTRGIPLTGDVNLEEIASRTHGYVGADLHMLVKEAALHSLQRILPNINFNERTISSTDLDQINISQDDFEKAINEVLPSALREVFLEIPNVVWSDIGGMEAVKSQLVEAIEWPLKYGNLFQALKVKPIKGILLYGPPGTGKTLLAKAIANEIQSNFISIKGPELLSKWIGEAEKRLREVFKKARNASPCIIFIDEIDSVTEARELDTISSTGSTQIISQLLTEMDGLEEIKNVIVLAATNRPNVIDPALMRPGRFDKIIYIGLPDALSREKILEVHLKGINISSKISLKEIAALTDNYSSAELAQVVQLAKIDVLRDLISSNPDQAKDIRTGEIELNFETIEKVIQGNKPKKKKKYNLKPPQISDLRDSGIA